MRSCTDGHRTTWQAGANDSLPAVDCQSFLMIGETVVC